MISKISKISKFPIMVDQNFDDSDLFSGWNIVQTCKLGEPYKKRAICPKFTCESKESEISFLYFVFFKKIGDRHEHPNE